MKAVFMGACVFLSTIALGAFDLPTNMTLVCVQDCKYGFAEKNSNGQWSIAPRDVDTFSYHVVRENSKIMFYGNPAPGGINLSVVRKGILDGGRVLSKFFRDDQDNYLQIGTINYYGEFELYAPEGDCSMKRALNHGDFYYKISCKNAKSGEFELSGIMVRTQRDGPSHL